MKRIHKLIFIPALVLTALITVRCFVTGEKKPEKTELLISILQESGLDEADLAPLIGEYVKLHPDLLINTEIRDREDLLSGALATETEGADPPDKRPAGDILILDGRYLRDFIDGEALLSLDAYLHSDSPLERWTLSLNSSLDLLFYNIDLLKEAGFDRPPGTREDYLRYARTLRDRLGNTGVYGSALGLSPEDSRGVYRDILSWIWSSGVLLTREGKLDFSGRALNAALDFLAVLDREGLLAPDSFGKTGEQRIGEFTEGKIGMMIASVRDIPRVREKMGDAFGVSRIPEPEDHPGKPVFGLSAWYGAISRRSAGRDAAWDFLLFLKENGPMLTEQLKTAPGHGEAASGRTADPLYSKVWDMYEGADLVQELLDFPGEAALEDALRRELEFMFRENRSAAETALAVQRSWDQWKP